MTTTTLIQGAHVNVVAQWNQSHSRVGSYQAPRGFIIESAVPVVTSESRSRYDVDVASNRRTATLSVSVRGSGEFWNKERGWFNGFLNITLKEA